MDWPMSRTDSGLNWQCFHAYQTPGTCIEDGCTTESSSPRHTSSTPRQRSQRVVYVHKQRYQLCLVLGGGKLSLLFLFTDKVLAATENFVVMESQVHWLGDESAFVGFNKPLFARATEFWWSCHDVEAVYAQYIITATEFESGRPPLTDAIMDELSGPESLVRDSKIFQVSVGRIDYCSYWSGVIICV